VGVHPAAVDPQRARGLGRIDVADHVGGRGLTDEFRDTVGERLDVGRVEPQSVRRVLRRPRACRAPAAVFGLSSQLLAPAPVEARTSRRQGVPFVLNFALPFVLVFDLPFAPRRARAAPIPRRERPPALPATATSPPGGNSFLEDRLQGRRVAGRSRVGHPDRCPRA
jgi:hypothetical protein